MDYEEREHSLRIYDKSSIKRRRFEEGVGKLLKGLGFKKKFFREFGGRVYEKGDAKVSLYSEDDFEGAPIPGAGAAVPAHVKIRFDLASDKGAKALDGAREALKFYFSLQKLKGNKSEEAKVIQRLTRLPEEFSDDIILEAIRESGYHVGKAREILENFRSRRGLEGRVAFFIMSFIGGLALSFSSLSTTGFAVSSSAQTSSGLGGVFLFVFGVVGLVFSLRRK